MKGGQNLVNLLRFPASNPSAAQDAALRRLHAAWETAAMTSRRSYLQREIAVMLPIEAPTTYGFDQQQDALPLRL